jgi:hypothetical protein
MQPSIEEMKDMGFPDLVGRSINLPHSRVIYLTKEGYEFLVTLVREILKIRDLSDVVSDSNIVTRFKELTAKVITQIRNKEEPPTEGELLEQLFETILSDVDWLQFFYAINGLELDGYDVVELGPLTIFKYTDKIIDQIFTDRTNDPGAEEHLRLMKSAARERIAGKAGISFSIPGDEHKVQENADIIARRTISVLRLAICLMYPEHASPERFYIEPATAKEPGSIWSFFYNQQTKGLGSSAKVQKGIQKLILDKEALDLLRRNNFEYLFYLCGTKQLTKLEESIMAATEWIGDAQGDLNPICAYSKYWFAIETLISTRDHDITDYLKRSIPIILSSACYSFIEEEELRGTMKEVSRLYGVRSRAAHHGKREIKNDDLIATTKFASQIVLVYLSLRIGRGYTNQKQINEHTDLTYLKTCKFVAIGESKTIHKSSCHWAIKSANKRIKEFRNINEARNKGYKKCKHCLK